MRDGQARVAADAVTGPQGTAAGCTESGSGRGHRAGRVPADRRARAEGRRIVAHRAARFRVGRRRSNWPPSQR